MFKRANKVTALLVAAASIMSIVPAMASTRIGTRDGHITGEAIAYDGGKYAYEGYRTTDDNTGVYYNNGSDSKEKFNDELRDYTLTSKYGTKYAYATDNNDQYLVDLTTGKIVDEETPETKADKIKSDLKGKLKRTDRYSVTGAWNTVQLGDSTENESYNDSTRLFGNKFGEVWYKYWAKGDNATGTSPTIGQVAEAAKFTIKLPTSLADNFAIAGTVYPGSDLEDLQHHILTAIKQDTTVLAVFDVSTIKLNNDNTITGQAAVAKEIKTTDTAAYAALGAFTTKYGAVYGAATVPDFKADTTTTAAVDFHITSLYNAVSSDQTVATSRIVNNQVEVTSVKAGQTTINVTGTNSEKATMKVTVDATGAIDSDITKYVSASELTVALGKVAATNATYADYDALGFGSYVDTTETDATKTKLLTVIEANNAVAYYLKNGVYGAAVSSASLTSEKVGDILDAAAKKKAATIKVDAKVVVTVGKDGVAGYVGNPGWYEGFVNESGKYIDASNLANVYVYSKAAQKTVKVKEYNKENADYGITVGLLGLDAVAQDKDYIYAVAKVAVVEKGAPVETQYFVQKISKASGDTKDEAAIPKSVESYQLDNKTIFDNGDAQVIYNLLVNKLEDGFTLDNVSVKDGALYLTGVKNDGDHDKVKVFKAALKKDKIDTVSTYGQGVKKDADVYIAKKDADTDIEIGLDTKDTAVAYDVDGNTWTINKGTITKITGTDKKDMYTCDHSFHNLDVYNDSNVIAWDKDADFYTNVAEGTKVTQGESTAVAPVIVTGWVKGTDGTWTFNDATGTKVVNKWQNLGGVWYFLKADGIMATGWYNDNGTWYYLNGSGAMQTGWLNDNGTWYYLAGSGAMLANTTVDGYVLGASGAWVK